jgi:FAD/FMN-containing dehydrogenase
MLENLSRLCVAMGGHRYLSGYVAFDDEEWRAHYGETWRSFEEAKRRFDPDGILNPGFVPLRGTPAPARKG